MCYVDLGARCRVGRLVAVQEATIEPAQKPEASTQLPAGSAMQMVGVPAYGRVAWFGA